MTASWFMVRVLRQMNSGKTSASQIVGNFACKSKYSVMKILSNPLFFAEYGILYYRGDTQRTPPRD